jgi:phosphopantothenoylcysteine decarboxylase/phosphopantothenate--cysteine ligase
MLSNPIVLENINKLRKFGYVVMESAEGELACNTTGKGRLPDIPEIIEEIKTLLTPKDFNGVKILITAGPTEEPIDPVRFITNLSSGKMGYALALAAHRRGAEVTLITGPATLPLPPVETIIKVRTAKQMYKAVMDNYKKAKIIIKAAAVADYCPKVMAVEKIKKDKKTLFLELERNPDIIAEIGKNKGNRVLIGFAMETQNLLANAAEKLTEKNMDLIVANDLKKEGAGFRTDTNIITIIDRTGKSESFGKMTKIEAAGEILNRVKKIINRKSGGKN